jgi:hypothetical protein
MRYNLAITASYLATISYASPGLVSPGSGIFARGAAPSLDGLPAEVQAAFTGKPIFASDFSGPAGAFQSPDWQYYNATGDTAPVNAEREIYPETGQTCALSGNGLQFAPKKDSSGNIISCRLSSTGSWQAKEGEKIIFAANLQLGTGTSPLNGFWPAFWALGENGRSGPKTPWPQCGEIDTMENINGANEIHSTVHCGPACKDNPGSYDGITATTPYTIGKTATFAHVIDRTVKGSETITFYVNGQSLNVIEQASVDAASWTVLAGSPFYIVMNVAIGGSWPESVTPFNPDLPMGPESGMLVNWVQVLSSSSSGAASPGASPQVPSSSSSGAAASVASPAAPGIAAAAPVASPGAPVVEAAVPARKRATRSFTA